MKWLAKIWCILCGGHHLYIDRTALKIKCRSCPYESKGWDIEPDTLTLRKPKEKK